MSDVNNPHDRFVKELISRPETARSLLETYLPEEIRVWLNLSTLKLAEQSWVDPQLREHFADLLYRLDWAGLEKSEKLRQPYLLLLVEHKSQPEREVAHQILQYMVQCWDNHLKKGKLPLPVVIPLVFYHGASEWKVSLQFAALFGELPDEMRPLVPHFEYQLLDFSANSKTLIQGEPFVRVALSLLRLVFHPDLAVVKAQLPEIFSQLPPSERRTIKYLETIFRYLSTVLPLAQVDMAVAIKDAFPQHGEIMKNWVDTLIDETAEKTELRIRMETAVELLNHRFGNGSVDLEMRGQLEKLSLESLRELCMAVLDFKSIEDLPHWLESADRESL